MKKEYFLFDLDGTLANSCEGVTNCIKYALVKMNRPIPSDEVLNMFLGPALSYSFKTFCNMDEETAEKAVAYYRERYTDKGVYENTIYDGVEDTLRELKNKGKKVILATAKPEPFARTILAYYKLDKYFDEIVGATFDASIIGTKDEVIKEVFKRCDIKDKAQVLMIGDRDHDVLGAKENGIECAGVTYGFAQKGELETAGADYIIDSMDEILKFC